MSVRLSSPALIFLGDFLLFSKFFCNFSVSFLLDLLSRLNFVSSRISSETDIDRNISSEVFLRFAKFSFKNSISFRVLLPCLSLGIFHFLNFSFALLWELSSESDVECFESASESVSEEEDESEISGMRKFGFFVPGNKTKILIQLIVCAIA